MQPTVENQRGRKAVDRQKLARKIWHCYLELADANPTSVPSEREFAVKLGLSRHAIRQGLQQLEDEGRLVRMGNGGLLPSSALEAPASASRALRCITFIRSPVYNSNELQWLTEDYLGGYTEALEEHELKTRFVTCDDDFLASDELLWPQAPYEQQGCVLVGRNMSSLLTWLSERGMPFVVQYSHAYDTRQLIPHSRVLVNKTGGAYAGTRHLIELGHQQIGFAGKTPLYPYDLSVYEGFRAAMKTAALDIRADWLWSCNTNWKDEARRQLRACFQATSDLPTAFLVENDNSALALIEVAAENGLRVPEDLSIIGFNDQLEAGIASVPLTTMRVPRHRLARTAVELLLEQAGQAPGAEKSITLECELIIRNSTSGPSSR